MSELHRIAVPGLGQRATRWHYPPTYLLAVYPLGLASYVAALVAFLVATVGFWAVCARAMFAEPRAWVVIAAFPAGLWNFANGQNGFLTAGLAGLALLALERRPIRAGFLIGLLAIKPHLAVLFPLALAAEGRWPAFVAAAATAVGFTALSIAAFGWATATAFLHDLTTVRWLIDSQALQWFQIPTVYVAALSAGLSPASGMVLQTVTALAAAACTWLTWRQAEAPREAKYAALCAASLLVSPYIFFYDLTWVGLSIAWLIKLGWRQGFGRGERELLAAVFVLSGLPMFAYDLVGVQLGWILPLALLALASRRAFWTPRCGGGTKGLAGDLSDTVAAAGAAPGTQDLR